MAVIMAVLMANLGVFAAGPLERGTSLSVRLASKVTSKKQGSPTAMVENDVKDKNGEVSIKRGTPVQLQIDIKRAKGCGKAGYVTVRCVSD